MRASLILVIAALIFAHPLVAQSSAGSSDTDSVRKQIEANNQADGRAIQARDFSTLEKFWSPQMVVNSPGNRVLTRDDVIASMKDGGGLNYSSLKGTTESFTVLGDIAVEMGHEDFVMAAGPAAGKPLQRRFTDVWQRQGDRWVQIARQATILNVDAAWVYGSASTSLPPQPH
jgi:ketosteroid isomerase-like protein